MEADVNSRERPGASASSSSAGSPAPRRQPLPLFIPRGRRSAGLGDAAEDEESAVRHVEEPLEFLQREHARRRRDPLRSDARRDQLRSGRGSLMYADRLEEEEESEALRQRAWEAEVSRRLQGRANVVLPDSQYPSMVRLEQAQRLYSLFSASAPRHSGRTAASADDEGGSGDGTDSAEPSAEEERQAGGGSESDAPSSPASLRGAAPAVRRDSALAKPRGAPAQRHARCEGGDEGEGEGRLNGGRRKDEAEECKSGSGSGRAGLVKAQRKGNRDRRGRTTQVEGAAEEAPAAAQDFVLTASRRISYGAGTVAARATLNRLWQAHHQKSIKQHQLLLAEQQKNVKKAEERKAALLLALPSIPPASYAHLLGAVEHSLEEEKLIQVELETELLQAIDEATGVYRQLRKNVLKLVSSAEDKERDEDAAASQEKRATPGTAEGFPDADKDGVPEGGETCGGEGAAETSDRAESQRERWRKREAGRQRKRCAQHVLALLSSILGDLQRYREQLDPPVCLPSSPAGATAGQLSASLTQVRLASARDAPAEGSGYAASVAELLLGDCLSPSLRQAFFCYLEGLAHFPHDGLVFNQMAMLCTKLQQAEQRRREQRSALVGADRGRPAAATEETRLQDAMEGSCVVAVQALAAVYWCLRALLCAFPLRMGDGLSVLLQRLATQDEEHVKKLAPAAGACTAGVSAGVASASLGSAAPASAASAEAVGRRGVWGAKAQVREHRQAAIAVTRNPLAVFVSLYFRVLHLLHCRGDFAHFHLHASECLAALSHLHGVWTPHTAQHEAFFLFVVLSPLICALDAARGCKRIQALVAHALATTRSGRQERGDEGGRVVAEQDVPESGACESRGEGKERREGAEDAANASVTIRLYGEVPSSLRHVDRLEAVVAAVVAKQTQSSREAQEIAAEAASPRAEGGETRDATAAPLRDCEAAAGAGPADAETERDDADSACVLLALQFGCELATALATQAIELIRQLKATKRSEENWQQHAGATPPTCAQGAPPRPRAPLPTRQASPDGLAAQLSAVLAPICVFVVFLRSHSEIFFSESFAAVGALRRQVATAAVLLFPPLLEKEKAEQRDRSILELVQQKLPEDFLLLGLLDAPLTLPPEAPYDTRATSQSPRARGEQSASAEDTAAARRDAERKNGEEERAEAEVAAGDSPETEKSGDEDEGSSEEVLLLNKPILLLSSPARRRERGSLRRPSQAASSAESSSDFDAGNARPSREQARAAGESDGAAQQVGAVEGSARGDAETAGRTEPDRDARDASRAASPQSPLRLPRRRRFPSPPVLCSVDAEERATSSFQARCARLWSLCVDTPEFQDMFRFALQVALHNREKLFLLQLQKERERQLRARLNGRTPVAADLARAKDEEPRPQETSPREKARGVGEQDANEGGASRAAAARITTADLLAQVNRAWIQKTGRAAAARRLEDAQPGSEDRQRRASVGRDTRSDGGERGEAEEAEEPREGGDAVAATDAIYYGFDPRDFVEDSADEKEEEEAFVPSYLASRRHRRRRPQLRRRDAAEASEEASGLEAQKSASSSPAPASPSAASPPRAAPEKAQVSSPPPRTAFSAARAVIYEEMKRQFEECAYARGLLTTRASPLSSHAHARNAEDDVLSRATPTCTTPSCENAAEEASTSPCPAVASLFPPLAGVLPLASLPAPARGDAKPARPRGEGRERRDVGGSRKAFVGSHAAPSAAFNCHLGALDAARGARRPRRRAGSGAEAAFTSRAPHGLAASPSERESEGEGTASEDAGVGLRDAGHEGDEARAAGGLREPEKRGTLRGSDLRPQDGSAGLSAMRRSERAREGPSQGASLAFASPLAPPSPSEGVGKLIVVDGSNVAMRHGGGRTGGLTKAFSTKGIQQAVDYYKRRGYTVRVFLPDYVLSYGAVGEAKRMQKMTFPVKEQLTTRIPDSLDALHQLMRAGLVVNTPSQDYDDSYAIMYAMKHDGCIVTNDLYRDFITKSEAPHSIRRWMRLHLISFVFIEDEFIPNPDFRWPPPPSPSSRPQPA
ncbi:hypothetical protein BESB_048900 [Besnoitia besnoiti]|uniref:RNase NYN domain-containing protein n=1 Tax=Besnoitia besnoiti TaxID=94643 RepID=A0A2A9MDW5_BESBE|nr:hypothetical protein BESB_048900 [Besnoitia besnoiti]PFH36698.1 hypothetical protein BESB_048900 [Besnoitia besnoiti]